MFKALLVEKNDDGKTSASVQELDDDRLLRLVDSEQGAEHQDDDDGHGKPQAVKPDAAVDQEVRHGHHGQLRPIGLPLAGPEEGQPGAVDGQGSRDAPRHQEDWDFRR